MCRLELLWTFEKCSNILSSFANNSLEMQTFPHEVIFSGSRTVDWLKAGKGLQSKGSILSSLDIMSVDSNSLAWMLCVSPTVMTLKA